MDRRSIYLGKKEIAYVGINTITNAIYFKLLDPPFLWDNPFCFSTGIMGADIRISVSAYFVSPLCYTPL